MRILISPLLIVATGLLGAQTSQHLRVRYGEADIERFIVASYIGLTVQYGSDAWPVRWLSRGSSRFSQRTSTHLYVT